MLTALDACSGGSTKGTATEQLHLGCPLAPLNACCGVRPNRRHHREETPRCVERRSALMMSNSETAAVLRNVRPVEHKIYPQCLLRSTSPVARVPDVGNRVNG